MSAAAAPCRHPQPTRPPLDPQPAQYVQSGTLTFTRDVDVLPTGFRLVNGNASCRLSEQADPQLRDR